MDKNMISTPAAPAAIGPYSQGIGAGDFLFTSGQIPIDPATGEVIKGSFADETRRAILNLKAVLEAGGSGLQKVVKTTLFITDMSKFAEVNGAYAEFFGDALPARSCVAVSALPKGANVEIEAVAIK